ncbi:MAG TPA: EF-hand domain-containing protein, partial [Phenylobacterium sp.]|nr:EF-hand domain-containing protein [Phenylobacterium sp.]
AHWPEAVRITDLSSLLSAQSSPPSASDIASQLISDSDTDGDGVLSLDEIKSKLSDTSDTDSLQARFDDLDSDSDGALSASELSSALEAQRPQGRPPGGHARGEDQGFSMADLASQLISDLDTDSDGSLGLDEVKSALSGSDKTSETSSDDRLKTALSSLDTDSDGKLSAAELSAALSAFQASHQHRGTYGAESASSSTSVTA